MKVFLTGATGFVGRRVARTLLDEGHEVTALLLPQEDAADVTGARIVRGDMTDLGSLDGLFAGQEAVVHLAGAVGYGQTWSACRALNVGGTRNVAERALARGVRRFVHMSSVSVYGRVWGRQLDERAPRRRIGDPYGDTKIEAEELLEGLARSHQLQLTMIRPTVIYGPGDRLFLPKLLENLRSGRARIIGNGRNRADLVHVDDVARFVGLVLKRPESVGQTFNITNPQSPDWRSFLKLVASVAELPFPGKRLPYSLAYGVAAGMELWSALTGRPPRLTRYAVRVVGRPYHYDTGQMETLLGFCPHTELLDGLRQCLSPA